ncbi:hypothetical protein DWX95_05255 [Butyricicoccus sp. AF22-28AC]|nr:CarD family transcriptional regulator [Butyricicoccus sp. AF22-28AC]RHQ83146.1 hypothetical protein DWX95_05255 [Butyricicoccus sp. AF22-28AC]
MYQAGEFIVYGTNSVCRVESIGKPPFETEEDKLYYTLVPVTGTETIYIPTDSPVFTRPVISREKAEELINSIPDIEEDHFVCHSVRMANEHYQAALQSHDCEELVQLIKTVYAKSRRHGRRVSQVDQRYRKRAEELLNSELRLHSVFRSRKFRRISIRGLASWEKRRQRKLQNKWKREAL